MGGRSSSLPPPVKCRAHNRQGNQCGMYAIPGGTVCRRHGGGAPAVRRSAALRLIELVDPAIATLAREMNNKQASAGERIRAAENVLDRAGYPRKVTTDSTTARDLLLQKLLELQASRQDDIVEGEVVEDA